MGHDAATSRKTPKGTKNMDTTSAAADSKLCDIDEKDVLWEAFCVACNEAGYPSPKAAANDCDLWGRTWMEAMHFVTSPVDEE